MEVLDKNRYIITTKAMELYVPIIQCQLFNPHIYLNEHKNNSKWGVYNYNEMVFFILNKQVVVTYDSTTHLPILAAYNDATRLAECFALGAWTTYEQHNNLTYM